MRGLAEIVGSGIQRGADADADHAAFVTHLRDFRLPIVPADQVLGLSSISP